MGEAYTPFQNEALVDYLQTMTDESGAFLDTAGSMRGGADVFVTMKLPTTMLVVGVNEVDLNSAELGGPLCRVEPTDPASNLPISFAWAPD